MTSSDSKPVIAVDDRQDPKWTRALTEFFEVSVKHLASGDFVWGSPLGPVGVEDKRFDDFVTSLQNKRLDDELRRLEAAYALPILFVRGSLGRAAHIPGTGEWTEGRVSKALLGRQLHGIYTYRTNEEAYSLQAAHLLGLWSYTQNLSRGFEGVRREKKLYWAGPLSTRAEVLYGILGGVGGVRNRRSAALDLAHHSVTELCTWGPTEWVAAGYTRHMAQKLTATFKEI